MSWLTAVTILTCVTFLQSLADRAPVVSTNVGQVQGETDTFSSKFLQESGDVYSYRGIPFAKPPINDRRFRPAEAMDPWEGVINATEIPPSCPQIYQSFYKHLYGTNNFSEDCLYLNVFAPRDASPNAAVMVFIHGGSFVLGSGSDFPYNPLPLVFLGDVILVTINYRLNIFGFFSTGDDAIPANLGLTDQRLALKWVNENIDAFGGDPQKVTVFGESAGSACISWHLLSEESRQYFQRVILQSGPPYANWANVLTPDQSRDIAFLAADIGGCTPSVPGDTSGLADCFRTKLTVEELLEIHSKVDELFLLGPTVWIATNDGEFFTDDVNTLIEEGAYSNIDILLGTNKDEGTFRTYLFTGLPEERPFVSKDFFTFITTGFNDPLVSDLLEAVYASGIDQEDNYVGALEDALSDTSYKCGTSLLARNAATAGSTVYMYHMTHEPIRSLWNVTWLRASHFEELQFVFGLPFFDDPFYVPVYDEVKIAFYVIRMWTNFAKSGDPNGPIRLPGSIPEWPRFVPVSEEYKELDIRFNNKRKLRQQHCQFWLKTLPEIVYLQGAVADNNDQGVSTLAPNL
ncbi:acetylcholinesterase-like [Apostichopus japonicus]|uniref:acetylcholinesterase-like n=1 Tax=Stichopus japonicus TaxID=307972 RepID=UPI003AB7BD5D